MVGCGCGMDRRLLFALCGFFIVSWRERVFAVMGTRNFWFCGYCQGVFVDSFVGLNFKFTGLKKAITAQFSRVAFMSEIIYCTLLKS